MNSKQWRLMADQLPNQRIDKHYKPLKQVLEKSKSRSRSKNRSKSDFKKSKISNSITDLTAEDAGYLEKNIYIPSTKLRATDNIWKVQGTKFTALDYSESYDKPISQNQLKKRLQLGKKFQQKLYEVSQSPQSESPQIKQKLIKREQVESRIVLMKAEPITKKEEETRAKSSQLASRFEGYPSDPKMKKVQKPKYKYNLFSIMDEATNTKCGSCSIDNEVIASKPNEHPWS